MLYIITQLLKTCNTKVSILSYTNFPEKGELFELLNIMKQKVCKYRLNLGNQIPILSYYISYYLAENGCLYPQHKLWNYIRNKLQKIWILFK